MHGTITVFVLFATALQCCLALGSSSTLQTTDEMIERFSVLQAYRAAADYQSKQLVYTKFEILRQWYANNVGCENQNTEYKVYTVKICQEELLAALTVLYHVSLEALAIVNRKASSDVTTARFVGKVTMEESVGRICKAIELAVGKNSSDMLREIQAIADEQVATAEAFNTAYFAAITNGQILQENMENAHSKVHSEVVSLIRNVFNMFSVVASGTCDSWSVLGSSLNESIVRLSTYFDMKFTLLGDYLLARIAASGEKIGEDGVTPADGNTSICDCDVKNDEDDLSVTACRSEDESKILADNRAIAIFHLGLAVDTIFGSIENAMPRGPTANKNPNANNVTIIRTTRYNVYTACTALITATLDAISIINFGATLQTSEVAVRFAVMNVVGDTLDTMETIGKGNLTAMLIGIQDVESRLSDIVATVTDKFYIACQSNEKLYAENKIKIQHARDRSISEIQRSCSTIFVMIKNYLAETFSGSKSMNGSLSIETAQTETTRSVKTALNSVFDVITIISSKFATNRHDKNADLSAIRSHKNTVNVEIENAVEQIFIYIKTTYVELSVENGNDRGNIETPRNQTSAASEAYIDAITNAILTFNAGAYSQVQAAQDTAVSSVNKIVDKIYDFIEPKQHRDATTNLNEIERMEDVILDEDFILIDEDIDVIQDGHKNLVQLGPEFELARNDSNTQFKKLATAIFAAIKTSLIGSKCDPLINSLYAEAYLAAKNGIYRYFDAIHILCINSVENQVALLEKLIAIRSYREVAIAEAKKAIDLIFESICENSTAYPPKNQNASGADCSGTKTPEEKTYSAYMNVIKAILLTASKLDTGIPTTLENTLQVAGSVLKIAVSDVFTGINSLEGNNSSKMLTQIEAIEGPTIGNSSMTISDIFIGLKYGLKSNAEVDIEQFELAQEKATSNVVLACRNIFAAMKHVVAEICSGPRSKGNDDPSFIAAARNGTFIALQDNMQITFNLFETISTSCVENETEIPDDSCPI